MPILDHRETIMPIKTIIITVRTVQTKTIMQINAIPTTRHTMETKTEIDNKEMVFEWVKT